MELQTVQDVANAAEVISSKAIIYALVGVISTLASVIVYLFKAHAANLLSQGEKVHGVAILATRAIEDNVRWMRQMDEKVAAVKDNCSAVNRRGNDG